MIGQTVITTPLGMNTDMAKDFPTSRRGTILSESLRTPRPDTRAGGDAIIPDMGDPIEQQPVGIEKVYTRNSAGFWSFFNTVYVSVWEEGAAMLVEGEDGMVYIGEPFSGLYTGTWLKCSRTGDKLVAQLPQPMFTEYYGETGYVLYAVRMTLKQTDSENFTYEMSENQTVTFSILENGGLRLDMPADFNEEEEFAPEILGLCTEEGYWSGVGDWRQTYTPFDGENLKPTDDLTTSQWAMTSNGMGEFVNVGIKDNEVWIQGFDKEVPDSWIRGEIKDGKVQFVVPQLLGFNREAARIDYFTAADGEKVWNEEWEDNMTVYTQLPEVTFDYDSDAQLMVLSEKNENTVLMVNDKKDEIYSHGPDYSSIRFRLQTKDFEPIPMDPVLTYYMPYTEEYGFAILYFDLPYVTNDGYILDRDKLFYKFYVDLDEWVFYKDEYEGLEEDMTMVPHYFDNGYTIGYLSGLMHMVCVYANGFENLGVRSVYKDGEEEYNSYLVYFTPDDNDATDCLQSDEYAQVDYYNLQGIKLSQPERGINIRKICFKNGTSRTDKIILK